MWYSQDSKCRIQAHTQQRAMNSSHTCFSLCCTVQYVGWFLPPPFASLQSFFFCSSPLAPLSSVQGLSHVNSSVLSRSITQCICMSKITLPHSTRSLGSCYTTGFETEVRNTVIFFATAPLAT